MRIGTILGVLLPAMLGTALHAAPTTSPATAPAAAGGTSTLIGEPCHAFNILASRVVKMPDGAERFVLTNSNETTGVELIFIDPKTNAGKSFRAPAGQGAWTLNQVPGDRLVVGTYYDGVYMVFDLKQMAFTKTIKAPGEQYIWNAVLGSDGRLYGGTYPGAELEALNLQDYSVEDCGSPAKPNLYLRNVSALPDGRVLCNFVTEKPTSRIYDPKTRQWSDPPPQMSHVQRGVTWNGFFLSGSGWEGQKTNAPGKAIAFRGSELNAVDPPPFPLPPKDGGDWSVDLTLTSPEVLYVRQGETIWRYRAGEKELQRMATIDIPAAAITATLSDGTLLGLRGQDYLVLAPGAPNPELRRIPVETGPRPPHFLRADSHQRLWGGPQFGETLFWVDLAHGNEAHNTGLVCNAGGEVYDVAFAPDGSGKVYAVAYSGGDIIVYDPAQPWDQIDNHNPRTLARLSGRGYIRPVAGALFGPGGKLYAGWMAKYGTYGGAISITDPNSGETELIENPLGRQGIAGLATDGRRLFAGTSLAGNGLPNQSGKPPHFGVIDPATKKVLFDHPMPGGGSVGPIVYEAKSRRVVAVAGGKLVLFDPETNEFHSELAADLPPVNGRCLAVPQQADGLIYIAAAKYVLSVDPLTGRASAVGEAPAKIEELTLSPRGAVYASCGSKVYRLRGE